MYSVLLAKKEMMLKEVNTINQAGGENAMCPIFRTPQPLIARPIVKQNKPEKLEVINHFSQAGDVALWMLVCRSFGPQLLV